jgi:plastocyanin
MRVLVFFILINYIFALAPVCREGGRLRSDLQFKYTYTDSISDSSKDVDFSQRSGEYVKCNAAGDSVTDGTITKSISCESVARSEGPGMDRFGWAKQIAVSVKGSVKIYSGDLNDASPTEFTSGDECGSTIEMALGSQYMVAVCKKAVRIYRFDGTTWTDHEEIGYPNAVDHELQVSLNHEDYLIVSEPSTTTVKVYKLGAIKLEVQSMTGDGAVAAAVNCMGSVFAYESSEAVKIKQLSQKDGSWSDLTDIAVDPVSLSMSSDVLAVGLVDNTNVYMFANSGTEYAEYKSLKGGDSFGKVISIEHEDLAIVDDNRLYLFKEGTATKCRAGQKLEDGVCVDCGPGHTNAHDNTDSVCNVLQCTSSQFSLAGTCSECPAGATGVAGPASVDSECTCAAGKTFDAPTGLCNPVLCAENEHVVSNVCTACAAGTTNVADNDSSGADTQCTATLCAVDEQVVGNACVACPAGSSNAKDDDASGADTTCDPTTTCAVDEFYNATSETCIPCPAGTNKAVAVDSMGGDSTCDAILCVENEHIKEDSGVFSCSTCTAGSERAAGDDLSTQIGTQCSCSTGYEGDGTTCTECGANQESAGAGDTCKCSAGSEGDGSACQACPADSSVLAGPVSSQCVKNEGAVWKDVDPDPVNHGNCDDALDCTTKAADPSTCTQPYEDGGNLQATSPCCKILEPLKCGCDENFRVANNVCIACTGGETRPAGDDPDGANTYCSTEGIGLAFGNSGSDHYTHLTYNDPDINLKVGQKYSFLRDTAGHPLRIVSAEDCDGKGCDTGTYTTLPTSSVSDVDAVQSSANIVWTPKKAGTYYYLCTSHPNMVGKLIVAWDVCAFGKTTGAVTLTSSCLIDSTITLTGAMSISAASARRLRSTGDKPLISFSGSVGVDAGVYALQMTGVEVTDVKSDGQLATSTTGTIQLTNVDLKDNPRNSGTGSLFKTAGGHIVGQNMVISNSKGETFEGESGGDISLADATVSGSGNIIKQVGGAVVVRGVDVTGGGKLADIEDATSIFEDVVTDGGEGIDARKSAVQIERSDFKNHGTAPVKFNSKGCTDCKRQLIIESTAFQDALAVDLQTDAGDKPVVKIIEGNFTNSGSVVSDSGIELYVIDEIDGKEMTTAETKTETCLPHQCSHKPLATSCKVEAGKGTKCICDVGVATYKASTKELEKQTTVEEILSILFATAETADRIVKMVDDGSRYIPTQPTAEASKSNILLMKPTNQDGKFTSEKTILLKPDSGTVCATFQTWLCAELTACHSSDGTFTAECDGTSINMPARHRLFQTNKFKRLRATHPEDSNCQGAISNLKQSCTDGAGATYERCVQYAYLLHDNCICIDGMKSNSAGDACLMEDNLCKINERVQGGRCVPCEGGKTNKAGDDMTAGNSQCDDVICKELYKSDGSGNCVPCAAGEFNLAGDIAYVEGTGNGEATTCCASGEYEYDVSIDAGGNIDSTSNFARTCKACGDATDPIRNRFGTTGGGLSCCRGDRLGLENGVKCGRIMDYYKKVCQPLESATTCPAQSYI